MSEQPRVLVTGAGGFIGSHLVTYLRARGYWVRGVDIKMPEFGPTDADEFELVDLRRWENCQQATKGIDEVFARAADMGGMGFISNHHAQILYNNSLIDLHTLEASPEIGVKRYLYTSSACIYPEHLQEETDVAPLKEADAYPAYPHDAYGWEKLISERLCMHYMQDYGIQTRTVRFHNIFGKSELIGGNQATIDAHNARLLDDPMTGVLGELGFGTQVLPVSGSDIQDEKVLGTCHLATGRDDHLGGHITPDQFKRRQYATHDDILFAPHKTPNFDIKQVRMNRGSQKEILIEHFQPSKYLLEALAEE